MSSRVTQTQRSTKWIWVAAGVVLLVPAAFLVMWLTSESAEDLLSAQSPTPAQIRKIATSLLVDSDLNIRSRASAKLSGLGEKATPILREVAAETRDPELRFAVLGILRVMDAPAAVQVVGTLIQNPDANVRQEAVQLAGHIEAPKAAPLLEKAIQDPDPAVRSSAASRLDPRASPSAASRLQAALKDPDYNVRRHAARQLRQLQQ